MSERHSSTRAANLCVTFAQVGIHAADRIQPIEIHARLISASVVGLPIVEYQHAALAHAAPMPTLLCFSGGGCSGAVFALLAEKCRAQGVRVIAFDMPGIRRKAFSERPLRPARWSPERMAVSGEL
jgi:pimeloyl-ACP methyl ester carboxylesterase